MSILSITNLTHTFDGKALFEDANLAINNGEHIGIVGLNGAGKSTFMNILCGKVIQDTGDVRWLSGIKWGYLDQHADIDRSLTVMQYLKGAFSNLFEVNDRLEAIYEQMGSETDPDALDSLINKSSQLMELLTKKNFFELESEIKKVANGLGIGPLGYDTLISTLSGGQRAKLMLALLLLSELDAVLLDEPTNFLDIEHVDWLKKFLNDYKGTVLVISHDTEFLNSVCRSIISVENCKIKKYSGNYDDFLAVRDMNSRQHIEGFERQQQQIKKMEDFIARNKARAATAGIANSRKKMLEKMDIITKPGTVYPSEFSFKCKEVFSKETLIVDNLTVGYGSKAVLSGISFTLTSETKLWIRGTNGVGKSTLIKTIMGVIPALYGSYRFSISAIPLYLEQDFDFYKESENAAVYMADLYPRMSGKEIRTRLGGVGIRNELATKPVSLLSGGEQVKVKLCGLMQRESNVLILDEPTNHLDVLAKESLLKAIREYKGAVILISHEKPFAEAVCNDVFDM